MKRKLKNFDKSFKELNKRRKLRGEKPLTEKAYANLANKIAVSRDGKINPLKQRGFDNALSFFGKIILEKKKSCIHCGKRKRYIDFIVRYNPPSIQNICRDCEQNRKKQYY
jgi:hypothetical protein